jgi:hypothetical protein
MSTQSRSEPRAPVRHRDVPDNTTELPVFEVLKNAARASDAPPPGFDLARGRSTRHCSEPWLAFNRIVVRRYRIHLEQRAIMRVT